MSACWYAAQAYCAWLGPGIDLPREAQWEFASRGGYDGTGARPYRVYTFGNAADCSLANYEGCAKKPVPVGETQGVSPNGIYDLAGMPGNGFWTGIAMTSIAIR